MVRSPMFRLVDEELAQGELTGGDVPEAPRVGLDEAGQRAGRGDVGREADPVGGRGVDRAPGQQELLGVLPSRAGRPAAS